MQVKVKERMLEEEHEKTASLLALHEASTPPLADEARRKEGARRDERPTRPPSQKTYHTYIHPKTSNAGNPASAQSERCDHRGYVV